MTAIPTAGGVVTHHYEPIHVIASLELRGLLKPSASLKDVFTTVGSFLFGREASDVFSPAALASVQLPSIDIQREGRIRLDVISILWERHIFNSYYAWRYLSPDSSPQLGWQWLVLREDSFRFNKVDFSSEQDAFTRGNFNAALQSRTCTLSTFGRRRGSLVKKCTNINNIHKMESGTSKMHAALTGQVYGVTADQGTEKGVADIDTMVPITGKCECLPEAMQLYPNAIWMPEHLHIFFNALQHAVEKLAVHKYWLNRLRQIEAFLSEPSLRRLFINLFMKDDPGLMKNCSRVHIDWR